MQAAGRALLPSRRLGSVKNLGSDHTTAKRPTRFETLRFLRLPTFPIRPLDSQAI